MIRQKSEDRIQPEDHGNVVPTRGTERRAGGEAVPVKEVVSQLSLFPETAEVLASAGADGGAVRRRRRTEPRAAPKSRNKESECPPATLEEVTERLPAAFSEVARNRGAPGPDGQTIEAVREHWSMILPRLSHSLLSGTYQPGDC